MSYDPNFKILHQHQLQNSNESDNCSEVENKDDREIWTQHGTENIDTGVNSGIGHIGALGGGIEEGQFDRDSSADKEQLVQDSEHLLGGVSGSGADFMRYHQPHTPLMTARRDQPQNNDQNQHMSNPKLVDTSDTAIDVMADINSHRSQMKNSTPNSMQKFLKNAASNKGDITAVDANISKAHKEELLRFRTGGSMSSTAAAGTEVQYEHEPILGGKFLVTKLRSWRTGYPRILCFHKSYFVTLDPDTYMITNRWGYHQVIDYFAVPNESDCMLIDVMEDKHSKNGAMIGAGNGSSTKLKLKCLPNNRDETLTALARCKYLYESMLNNIPQRLSHDQRQQRHPFFQDCHRVTRHNTRIASSLLCAPHGLIELDLKTRRPLQTYLYRCIDAISFANDNDTGIILYIGGTGNASGSDDGGVREIRTKIFLIASVRLGGSGRSDLVTVMKDKYGQLGLGDMKIKESIAIKVLIQQKRERGRAGGNGGTIRENVGERIDSFRVVKYSERSKNSTNSKTISSDNANQGYVIRDLVLTREGYLVEWEHGASVGTESLAVNCRSLHEILSIIRHKLCQSGTQQQQHFGLAGADTSLTIEYKDGSSRTYSSPDRDSMIVSILDAAIYLCGNVNVTVSDTKTSQYRLFSLVSLGNGYGSNIGGDRASALPKPLAGVFAHIGSVEMHCLKRVNRLSSTTDTYMNQTSILSNSSLIKEQYNHQSLAFDPVDECAAVVDVCREFNVNVSILGICRFADEKKYTVGAIKALWGIVTKLYDFAYESSSIRISLPTEKIPKGGYYQTNRANSALIPIFQTLYRLMLTPTGYRYTVDDKYALEALSHIWQIDDVFTSYWSLKCLSALVIPRPFALERDVETEFRNKAVILGNMEGMVEGLVRCMLAEKESCDNNDESETKVIPSSKMNNTSSRLILMVTSNILESLLCSHHDTTSPQLFSNLLTALGKGCNALMELLQSSTSVILENTVILVHLLAKKSPDTSVLIREISLSSGILLHHFYNAIYSPLEGQRFLSRYLCSLWMTGQSSCSEKRLLKRMVPIGFFSYLKMPILSTSEEDQLDSLERDNDANVSLDNDSQKVESSISGNEIIGNMNMARLRSRMKNILFVADEGQSSGPTQRQHDPQENFRIFFHVLSKDHFLPDLIWNQETRQELRISLESEIHNMKKEAEVRGGIDKFAWNHEQFSVAYPSLNDKVQIGGVYMALWLQATSDSFIKTWDDPVRLFELLFRRLLCDMDRDNMVTNMCIQCLERLYLMKGEEIGPFPDVMILVRSMAKTRCIETQHRLLSLIATLLGVSDQEKHKKIYIPDNAEQLLNIESIYHLCQFVAWGHTNAPQIGNSFSSAIDEVIQVPLLITTAPSVVKSEKNSSNGEIEFNSPSTPVWYVAPPDIIPPLQDTIQGPFSVSEVKVLLQNGKVRQQSLLSAAHVDDYNFQSDISSMVNESSIDTRKWRTLADVWQLRWQLCADSSGIYSPGDVSLMGVKCLSRLLDLHKSVDSRGVPYFPIPIAKRLLCGLTDCFAPSLDVDTLSILCQSLLCNDSRIVENTARLLQKLMIGNNTACSKFYLTGVFFFAISFTGSNFLPLANLCFHTHLNQNFLSGSAAASSENDLPFRRKSILGNMLPEGLLNILVKYGADKFAENFVSNCDTPEVIWSVDMRKHLVEMIRQHLGDFPKILNENTTAKYDYCPIPGIAYYRLKKELLFVGGYYLNNLCDEVRFPGYPISDPVELFRACLQKWKDIGSQDETNENGTQEESWKLLGLKAGDGGAELRKAYRNMARKYHPDKNPTGREMFEKVKKSYEVLMPILRDGIKILPSDDININSVVIDDEDIYGDDVWEGIPGGRMKVNSTELIIRAQLLICKRYADHMGKYKYPAYDMLLSCLRLPLSTQQCEEASKNDTDLLSCCLLRPKRAAFTKTAVELLFHTCLVSPLNAEELVIEKGILILEEALDFYIRAAGLLTRGIFTPEAHQEVASVKIITEIIVIIVHAISGIAYFKNGCKAILLLPHPSRLCLNWCQCLDLQFLQDQGDSCHELRRYALEGLANMSRIPELQKMLTLTVWPLVRTLLDYDPNSKSTDITNSGSNLQATKNLYAELAAKALGMLCGVMIGNLSTEPNVRFYDAIKKILTPPIAKMLRNSDSIQLLRTISMTIETPTYVWNAKMRNELINFIDKMQVRKGSLSIEEELAPTNNFHYTNLLEEVNIGGVYVRIFNKFGGGREGIREIPDCSTFARSLLEFIGRSMLKSKLISHTDQVIKFLEDGNTGCITDTDQHWAPVTSDQFKLAIEALLYLIQLDGLVDDVVCGDCAPLLLSLLEVPKNKGVHGMIFSILLLLSPKQVFADAIASQGGLTILLRVLEKEGNQQDEEYDTQANTFQQQGWSVFESLVSSPSIANTMVSSTYWLELIAVIAGYSSFTKLWAGRQGAAKTLSRLLWDPNTSPLIAPLLERFLPRALVLILKNSGADSMLLAFDKENETPELIWDSDTRKELRSAIANLMDKFYKVQGKDLTNKFCLPSGYVVKYKKLQGELVIGNVYVRLFLKDPTYDLRDASGFLEMLLQRWSQEFDAMVSNEDGVEISEQRKTDSHLLITTAKQDVIELVTSASVYLCKLHSHLCIKLAQWGYMGRAIGFMQLSVARKLIGIPLVSAIRLIHVAASEQSNVEVIALVGDSEGKNGIVEGIMKAMSRDKLHPDSAFMVETLNRIVKLTLNLTGTEDEAIQSNTSKDINCANEHKEISKDDEVTSFKLDTNYSQLSIIPPSPAPGTDPVKKLNDANHNHPLAMFLEPDSVPLNIPKHERTSSKSQNQRGSKTQQSLQGSFKRQSHNVQGRTTLNQGHLLSTTYPLPQNHPTQSRSNEFSSKKHLNSTFNVNEKFHENISKPVVYNGNVQTPNPLSAPAELSPTKPESPPKIPEQSMQGSFKRHSHNVQGRTTLNQGHLLNTTYPLPQNHSMQPQSNALSSKKHLNSTFEVNEKLHVNTSKPVLLYNENVQTPNLIPAPAELPPTPPESPPKIPGHSQLQKASNGKHDIIEPQTSSINTSKQMKSFDPVSVTTSETAGKSSSQRSKLSQNELLGLTKARRSLLFSILQCNLPLFLIEDVMENVSLPSVKDPGSLKMYAIELLQILLSDNDYGPRFKMILDGIPNWNKHKDQDYSLFASSTEKKENLLLNDNDNLSQNLLTNYPDIAQVIQQDDKN